jgi:RNA polymerase sigma factor (sigma-70 family)
MATHPLQAVVRHLRRMARPSDNAPSSDAELLTRFAGRHDEFAFAEIVQRHGPLVWAVCRNGLTTADADDAFQAAFLILTKQATRIRKPAALAGWLAGVARRVVRRVRIKETRRTAAEQRLAARPRSTDDSDRLVQSEWRQLLNEELHQLPEKYLLPMLLCYYQGLTNEEAAKRLGVPHGTVCGRLSRARELLRRRLIRRGVTLTVGALTAGAAGLPAEVLAATLATCGSVTNAGANLAAPVLTLAEAVMKSIWVEKVRVWTIGLAAITVVGGGSFSGLVGGPTAGRRDSPNVVLVQPEQLAPAAVPPRKIEELEQAGTAIINGQVDEALKFLRLAKDKYPSLPPVRLMQARLYRSANPRVRDDKKLRSIMDLAAAENPNHPLIYLELAQIAILEGRNTEAILDCQTAIAFAAAPQWSAEQRKDVRSSTDRLLALARNRRGEWAFSRPELARLLELSPKDVQLRQEFARTLLGMGEPDEAFRQLSQVYKEAPEVGRPDLGMATLYAALEDTQNARKWFEKTIEEQPKSWDSWEAHFKYGEWLLEQRDLPAARRHAETAVKLGPQKGGNPQVEGLLKLIDDGEKGKNKPIAVPLQTVTPPRKPG